MDPIVELEGVGGPSLRFKFNAWSLPAMI